MSLLTVVQAFCRRTNITVPSSVVGSTDEQVLQTQALLEEEGEALADRFDWQELTYEATLTTVATEAQGAISTIASNGFDHIKVDTFWDRTLGLPIIVLDGQEWQGHKALTNAGPRFQARIRGGQLLATPVPNAGNTWSFEYVSKNWVLSSDGVTYQDTFTNDNDTMLLPEKLFTAGLRWRWKRAKGFDYSEEFMTYEHLVAKAMSHNGLRKSISQAPCDRRGMPGIFVPQGTWPL